jgi:hypothetical protein
VNENFEWEQGAEPGSEYASLAYYDNEDDPDEQIVVIGTVSKDPDGGWNWTIEDENNSFVRGGWEQTKRQAKAAALKWALAWADEDITAWESLVEPEETDNAWEQNNP